MKVTNMRCEWGVGSAATVQIQLTLINSVKGCSYDGYKLGIWDIISVCHYV
jgi:hypothetical protein